MRQKPNCPAVENMKLLDLELSQNRGPVLIRCFFQETEIANKKKKPQAGQKGSQASRVPTHGLLVVRKGISLTTTLMLTQSC